MRTVLIYERDENPNLSVVDEVVDSEEGLKLVRCMDSIVFFDSEAASPDYMKDPICFVQLMDSYTCILIDAVSVDIYKFAREICSRKLVIHNAKNDLCFLYRIGIYPYNVWCTMVIEKLLAFGLNVRLSLEDLVEKYTSEIMDKSDKGKILYQFTDAAVQYCINDVKNLSAIYKAQIDMIERRNCMLAAMLENKFVVVLAYMQVSGVYLNTEKWAKVIEHNEALVATSLEKLNEFVYKNFAKNSKFCMIDMQGDLFEGFRETKKCFIKWNSDSHISTLLEKCTDTQREEIASLLNNYRGMQGITKTYGKTYISFVTSDGRIHPNYKQLTLEGRISCPQKTINRYGNEMAVPSFMGLPRESMYRDSVEAEEGNVLIGADWSSHEVCILAYISKDKELLGIIERGENVHDSMFSVLKGTIPDTEYERLYPNRKQINLMLAYLGSDYGLRRRYDCSEEIAAKIIKVYSKTFTGLTGYQRTRVENIIFGGMVPFNDSFGYRMYIQDIERMRRVRGLFKKEFWKNYSIIKKQFPDSPIVQDVIWYNREKDRLQRLAVQGPVANTGSIMFKFACIILMKKLRVEKLIGTVKITIPQHDSITIECPEDIKDKCLEILTSSMDEACNKVCPGLKINIKTWVNKTYR